MNMSNDTNESDQHLWNDGVDAATYSQEREKYQTAILEQYKIYVEMADRISQRRSLANTFFLTLNTAVLTTFSVFWQKNPPGSPWWLTIPLLALLAQCGAWYYLLRSYRQLNTAKYRVIGQIERRLPASPYWRAEWSELGEGKDWRKYLPLTHMEQWIPITFAVIYVLGFIVVLCAR
jgi:hypothetical protein